MTSVSRRAYYRVVYPLTQRPTFEAGRFVYEVIECSELGLRYELQEFRHPKIGTEMEGVVQFRRGASIEVVGQVLRAHSGVVVLLLDPPGITFSGILAEQRYLRSIGYTLRD